MITLESFTFNNNNDKNNNNNNNVRKPLKLNRNSVPMSLPRYRTHTKIHEQGKPSPSAEAAEDKNVIREELKLMWLLLKVVGFLPLQESNKSETSYKLFSLEMIYAIIVNVPMVYVGVYKITSLLRKQQSDMTLGQNVAWFLNVMFTLPPFFLAFTHWLRAGRISALLNDWMAFQMSYLRVTRTRLRLGLLRPSTWLVITTMSVSFLGVVAVEILIHGPRGHHPLGLIVYYGYSSCLMSLQVVVWYLLCEASKRASQVMMSRFKQSCLLSNYANHRQVAAYRLLWHQLSHLTRSIGHAYSYAIGFVTILWVLNLLLGVYEALSMLNNEDANQPIGLFIFSFAGALRMYWFCHAAASATYAVGIAFKDDIAAIYTNHIASRSELEKFNFAIYLDPPTISLGGFVTVDNQLIVKINSTVVTYMVVLLQYHPESVVKPKEEVIDVGNLTNLTLLKP